MSAAEIQSRVLGMLRGRKERRIYRSRRRNSARHPAPSVENNSRTNEARFVAEQFLHRTTALVPGAKGAEQQRLSNESPETHGRLRQSARSRVEAILLGEHELLGQRVDLSGIIDWHRDPRGEFCWPREFYADLNLYELDDNVDVKYVWELGRQQYVVDLARGWLLLRDERLAQQTRALMLDWIDDNPLYEGIHWTGSLEVAMRAISWSWSLAMTSEWTGWNTEALCKIASALAEHAEYLEHHLSYYSSPYNHLIGEATGLYLIGALLEQHHEADRWQNLGRDVLIEHGPRQFYADGFCVEQAMGYHFYTLGFMVLAICAARFAGQPLDALEPVVHRAFRAGVACRQPNGEWPPLGDVDSARSIPVGTDNYWDFRPLCSTAAVLFDDARLHLSSEDPAEDVYWLFGCDGISSLDRLAHGADSAGADVKDQMVLDDSGHAIARRDEDWLMFSAGPLAAGLHADATPSTAHGHANALQVLWRTGGKAVFVDSGMPFYFGPRDWVDHFREASAHNTIEVEGLPIARTAGRLMWSHVQPRPELDVNFSAAAWMARGRCRLDSTASSNERGVVIERYLLGLPEAGLWIADWIEFDEPRTVRWYWQLAAGTLQHCTEEGVGQCSIKGNDVSLCTWSEASDMNVRVEAPQDGSPVARHAPEYGRCLDAQRVCFEANGGRRHFVVTHVGSTQHSAQVTIRGTDLKCTNNKNEARFVPASESFGSVLGADVNWQIETDQGLALYSAGDALAPTKDADEQHTAPWTPLVGVGGWPSTQAFLPINSVC